MTDNQKELSSPGKTLDIKAALRECGFIVHGIKGVSMLPTLIEATDSVRLVPSDGIALKKYDIPLYTRRDGSLVLHRIIGRRKDGVWIIRGDNCLKKEYIPPERIIAVAEGYYRDGEYHPFSAPEAIKQARLAVAGHTAVVMEAYARRLKNRLKRK